MKKIVTYQGHVEVLVREVPDAPPTEPGHTLVYDYGGKLIADLRDRKRD